MANPTLTYNELNLGAAVASGSFTVPPGVNALLISSTRGGTTNAFESEATWYATIPNTTYVITANSDTYSVTNTANTFGSLFTFGRLSNSNFITIGWFA